MKEEWVVSTDEEWWDGVERYASREDAIVHGPDELDLASGERYWVGRVRSILDMKDETVFSGDLVIERLRDAAYDMGGEFAEDWLGDATREQVEELTRDGAALVRAWIERHGHSPSWFTVDKVSEHEESGWPERCERHGCEREVEVVFDTPENLWIFTCGDHAAEYAAVELVSESVKLDDWKLRDRRDRIEVAT